MQCNLQDFVGHGVTGIQQIGKGMGHLGSMFVPGLSGFLNQGPGGTGSAGTIGGMGPGGVGGGMGPGEIGGGVGPGGIGSAMGPGGLRTGMGPGGIGGAMGPGGIGTGMGPGIGQAMQPYSEPVIPSKP